MKAGVGEGTIQLGICQADFVECSREGEPRLTTAGELIKEDSGHDGEMLFQTVRFLPR